MLSDWNPCSVGKRAATIYLQAAWGYSQWLESLFCWKDRCDGQRDVELIHEGRVGILVLLEGSLRLCSTAASGSGMWLESLFCWKDRCDGQGISRTSPERDVGILVLLEGSLRLSPRLATRRRIPCWNPCSVGRIVATIWEVRADPPYPCWNPCSVGRIVATLLLLCRDRAHPTAPSSILGGIPANLKRTSYLFARINH